MDFGRKTEYLERTHTWMWIACNDVFRDEWDSNVLKRATTIQQGLTSYHGSSFIGRKKSLRGLRLFNQPLQELHDEYLCMAPGDELLKMNPDTM